jgi:energy-coupling factor transporter ATP-binding protein EcfA2
VEGSLYTRGFRRLKLAPGMRASDSIALDREMLQDKKSEAARPAPPFEPWPQFMENFRWEQGEHISLAGETGSGKTSFTRQLLPRRTYVAVLGTKALSASLYRPLEAMGFVTREKWDPKPADEPKVIFKPPLIGGTAGKDEQREAFREMLTSIFEEGNWCVYLDEARYITNFLGLKTEMELLWEQGRELGISVVMGAQRPVNVPVIAWEAQHLFVWRYTEKRDVDTISEFTGTLFPVVRQTIPRLPEHEVLHIQPQHDRASRTILPAAIARGSA